MKSKKNIWIGIIVISLLLLLGYSFLSNPFLFKGEVWPNWFSGYQNNSGTIMNSEEIKREVNKYIAEFDEELEIADMFLYEDSDYYVSIEEVDTGKGAMELLVNPFSGAVYPEYGPNMMWNEKYGMHGRGMMGMHMQNRTSFNEYSGYYSNEENTKSISIKEAVELSNVYVKRYISEDLHVTEEGHEFYGYYTLHIKKEEQTVGMLSINYYTGDVWFHDWHGKLTEVISHHDD